MRRRLVLLVALGLVLSIAPGAAAGYSGTSSTGDVDLYGDYSLLKVCPAVVSDWVITLTLEDPSLADTVSLTAQGQVTTVVDVATGANPTASVFVHNSHGCLPLTQVTGVLVDGTVDYTLTFEQVSGLTVPIGDAVTISDAIDADA